MSRIAQAARLDGKRRSYTVCVEYVTQLGGRVFDLPPHYHDLLARAVRLTSPVSLPRALVALLVSGRYLRSLHPRLVDATPADVERWLDERHAASLEHYHARRTRAGFTPRRRARPRRGYSRVTRELLAASESTPRGIIES